jgi:ligand-binding sensor domain-containing protein
MCLVALPFNFGAEDSMDFLNGDDTVTGVTVEFDSGGTDKTNSFVVNRFANVTQATLNLTTAPKTGGGTDYPTDLSLKVGDDTQDPIFEFPGSMGFSDTFIGGETSPHVSFDSMVKTDTSTQVSLPKNANIEHATFDIEGLGSNFNGSLFVNIDFVNCIEVDTNTGATWYGTSGGVVRMNTSGERTVYTITDGLCDPFVSDLAIDNSYIYIGTQNGTCMFNKGSQQIEGTVFRIGSGLKANETHALAVDSTHLYIGNDIVVSRYNKGTKTFDSEWSKAGGQLNDFASVSDMMVDGGKLYIGQSYGGVSIWDGAAWSYWNSELTDSQVTCLGADANNIYIGTVFELNIYDRSSTLFSTMDTSNGLLEKTVTCVGATTNNVYFGTQSGVSVHNSALSHLYNWTKFDLGVDIVQALTYDSATNRLLIGTYGNGTDIFDFNIGGFRLSWITGNGPLDNAINHILFSNNKLYFSTNYGISVFNDASFLFDEPMSYDTISGFPSNFIKATAQIGNVLYIGTNGVGVYRYDLNTQSWVTPVFKDPPDGSIASDFINCLEVDGTQLIIGSAQGLDIWDTSGAGSWVKHLRSADLPDPYVQSIATTATKIYIGTAGGVAVYNQGTQAVDDTWTTGNTPELLDDSIRALEIDSATGHIYMGTNFGVSIKFANGTWDNWTSQKGDMVTNMVRAIHIDSTYIYVGGVLSGVMRYKKSDGTKTYWNLTTRLPHNTVYCFDIDPTMNILYIGTQGGIGRYNLTAGMFFGLSSATNTYPKSPKVNIVGSDAAMDWSFAGSFETKQTNIDIATDITDVLAAATPDVVDDYKTEFVNVTFEVSVGPNSVGVLSISNLDIRYSLDVSVSDFASEMNTYTQAHTMWYDENDNFSIPLNVTSSSAGKVIISGIYVAYDYIPRPPVVGWLGLEAVYNFSDTQSDMVTVRANCTDPDDDIDWYEWLLFREGVFDSNYLISGDEFNFSASELGSGNYTLNLTVGDTQGMTDRISGNFTIGYDPTMTTSIIAIISNPEPGQVFYESQDIEFDGSDSITEQGNITLYKWTRLTGGTEYELGEGEIFSISTLEVGTHTAVLFIENDQGQNDTAQVLFEVKIPNLLEFSAVIQDDADNDVTISVKAKVSMPNLEGSIEKRSPAVTEENLPEGKAEIGVFFAITGSVIQHFVSCEMTVDLSEIPDPMTGTIPRINDSKSLLLYDSGVSPFGLLNSTLDPDTFIITAHINDKTTIIHNLGVLGDEIPDTHGNGDPEYPTVLATKPTTGAQDVPLDTEIDIKFSHEMDDQVLKTSIYVTNQVGAKVQGKLTYNPTNEFQAKFTPDTLLSPLTVYTVRINSSAKHKDGWRLDGNGDGTGGEESDYYEWSFTTTADVPDDPDGDDDGFFDSQTTIILIILLVVVLLILVGVFAFMFLRDKAKEAKIDKEMKDAEGKQMVICTSCGHENEIGAKSCSSCGSDIGVFKEREEPEVEEERVPAGPVGAVEAPAEEVAPENVLASDVVCPSCSTTVEAGMSACPGCGESDFSSVEGVKYKGDITPVTEDVTCPACSTLVPAGSTACPSCGEEELSAALPASAAPEEVPVEAPSQAAEDLGYTPGAPLPKNANCPICETEVEAGNTNCPGCGEEDFSAVL